MTHFTATLDSPEAPAREDAPFLRRVLLADAVTSVAAGLLMLLGAGPMEELLGLPAALTRPLGVVLLAFAALVAFAARRDRISRGLVWTIVVLNGMWAFDSVLLLVSGSVSPMSLGIAFVLAQAVAVAVFAELEWVGLRRA